MAGNLDIRNLPQHFWKEGRSNKYHRDVIIGCGVENRIKVLVGIRHFLHLSIKKFQGYIHFIYVS